MFFLSISVKFEFRKRSTAVLSKYNDLINVCNKKLLSQVAIYFYRNLKTLHLEEFHVSIGLMIMNFLSHK